MNARRLALGIVAGIVVVVTLASGWWFMQRQEDLHLDIEASQLQQRLAARLPARSCMLVVACAVVSDPVVQLQEGSDRIAVAVNILVSLGKRQHPARVTFSGKPRYVRQEGAFYLDDVQFDDLQLDKLPPDYAEVIRRRGPAALRQALQGQPIYSLQANKAEEAFAKLVVRDIRVADGKLRVTFIRFAPEQ